MSMSLTVDLKESGGQRDPNFPEYYFNACGLPYAADTLDGLIAAPKKGGGYADPNSCESGHPYFMPINMPLF